MSHPTKPKPLTYADAIRTYDRQDVQEDLNDACSKLAHAMSAMMDKFDAITKQMHSIDILRKNSPLKPRWDSMRKDLTEVLWQFRTNSTIVSGRLKLFCSMVLPMTSQQLGTNPGRSPHYAESFQVLQSFMTISAEHAAITASLVQRWFRLNSQLISFLSDLTKLATRHATSGQQELWDVSQKLGELENLIQLLFTTTNELSTAEVSHVFFTSTRLLSSVGYAAGRSKLTRKPIVLDGDLTNIGRAYEYYDKKQNEVAHAQYSSQLRQSRTDPSSIAQTMVSAFLLDQMLLSESTLSLFSSIWLRLRSDCNDMFHWLKNPSQTAVPAVIYCFAQSHSTLYAPLATTLDVFATGIDPLLCTTDRR